MTNYLNGTMQHDIFKFLEEHIVENGQVSTHTSMGNPKGSYYIKDKDLDKFYELYDKALFDSIYLHITERHEEISPIIIDLDFKYSIDTYERKHTIDHLIKIIKLYIDEIINLFNIEKGNNKLISFVFERDTLYSAKTNTVKKDGIHIIFPFIISHSPSQYYIRDNILKKIGDVINDLDIKNNIPDIVDRSIISPGTCWLLFGSNKPIPEVKNNPYKLKYIFNENVNEVSMEDYFQNTNISLTRFFSIRNRKDSDLTPIRDDKISLLETTKIIKKKKQVYPINYDIQKIRDLVSMLNESRNEIYSQWIEVGFVLHNIDPNSEELRDIYIDFSKKSDKFKEGECEKIWEKCKNEGLSLATLHYWAKIDNYPKYKEFRDKDVDNFIESSIKTQSNYDIAMVLYKMYEYDFKYSDNDWYTYRNHRWHKETDGMSLRKLISTELVKKYGAIITFYNKLSTNPDTTEEEKEEYKKKNAVVLEVTKKLKTTSFKDCIMKECRELFYDKEFIQNIDTNLYLLCFTNGIYDLKKGELRCGRPDDNIQLCTGIEKIDFDENNEYWIDLNNFISTVFADIEMKEYFLTYISSCLQGHNAEEKFRIWTGCGSNGKSKILELIVFAMGEYTHKFSITLLTGKRAASNACTPEIIQSKGKRFAYFEEPSEGEKINAGLLKEMTGGDKQTGRDLFKSAVTFKPQSKLALLCNDIPEVPANDTGTARRLEVVEFKSRFCENPKESNEYPIDMQLSEKLKNWKELFMALLIDVYYKKYKETGIKVPYEVVRFTLDFQKQCDLYNDFTTEYLDETKEMVDSIDINLTYDEFKGWYHDVFNNNKIPSKVEFKKYFKKKYPKRVTVSDIKGFKFKLKYDKKAQNELKLMSGY